MKNSMSKYRFQKRIIVVFLLLHLLLLPGCSDLFKATSLGRRMEQNKLRKAELKRRYEEEVRYFLLCQEALERDDKEFHDHLVKEHEAKKRHYEMMDKLNQIIESQEDLERANDRRYIRHGY